MDDCISRQAAIDLVKDVCDAVMSGCETWYDPEIEDEVYEDIREVDAILKCNKEVRIALRNMPSAQRWIPDEDCYLMWQYCHDPNDIDKAIKGHDEDWEGLESLHQIISITYDTNHGCYVVFWIAYRGEQE